MKRKRIVSALLALMMCGSTLFSGITAFAAEAGEGEAESSAVAEAESEPSAFAQDLETLYIDPDRVYSTDVRWWIGEAANTDEVLLEEIHALYDAGFRGVELCMQTDNAAPDEIYAYGSDMWSHKWKLMMNELLDLGMGVYLTSGTNWATSNVPGLDPDTQAAMQNVSMGTATVDAGGSLTALPTPSTRRNVAKFIGAYAYLETGSNVVDYNSMIDLTALAEQGGDVWEQNLDWTAPDDGTYRIFALWTQSTYQTSSPSAEPSYCTNYFDERGVEALREFWEANYLNDPELNQKILDGDVQLFMDSLEISLGGGITFWAEDMAEEFQARKGYDIRPYLFLISGIDQSNSQLVRNPYYPTKGTYDLDGNESLREKLLNDYFDVMTDIYMERMLLPLKEWLNSVGIKTRAQITYGRTFDISEPIMAVDYPEAENLNQYNQVDIFRLWTGGSKLQNKVLSTESSAFGSFAYGFTNQLHLRDAYAQYAAGFQRVIWHVWSADYGYGDSTTWPGPHPGMAIFYRLGMREPSYRDYDEFNAHLGRVQQLLQTGRSRTDVGFIHNNWVQGIRFGGGTGNDITGMNWQLAHQGIYYRSTELQDNGYTYDYFSPEFLFADDVYFDEDSQTIEQAGYKAVVLYQNWLDIKGAERLLEWARKGLKVVIIDGAAQRTPFADGKDGELKAVIDELKTLPTVRTAEIYDAGEEFDYANPVAEGYEDGVLEALQDLGVRPYAGFAEENHQLLTQSRQDDNGNLYLYVYNYCTNDYHHNSHIEKIRNLDHGTDIQTEIKMDGTFIPYTIDPWSGAVTELANYSYEDGQTVISVDLDHDNIALFAFEAIDEDDAKLHVVSTNAESAYAAGSNLVVRAAKTGLYNIELSNGATYSDYIQVPESYDITDWDLTVESWTAGDNVLLREETLFGVTTVNSRTETAKTDINVNLPQMTTWNNIPEVGRSVSGLGHYEATFDWDANTADGAYLDFGDTLVQSMKVWINGEKVGGDVSQNPTKAARADSGNDIYAGGISWTQPIVDISTYLVDGENEIVIEYSSNLTNVQLSRGAINASQNASGWWGYHVNYREYGPSQAKIVPFVEKEIDQLQSSDGLKLSTDAYDVEAGGYANITTEFVQTINSNTAILNYTFDTDIFQYADFHPDSNAVRVISKEATDTGAKVVVMISDYNTQTYGRLAIQAKPDAELITGWESVMAQVEYVVRDENGEKEIKIATASTAFRTRGERPGPIPDPKGDTNGDGIVDLIDLSNMIDWFGIDSSDSQWNDWYVFFDFNDNSSIDIYDIVYVARLIQ